MAKHWKIGRIQHIHLEIRLTLTNRLQTQMNHEFWKMILPKSCSPFPITSPQLTAVSDTVQKKIWEIDFCFFPGNFGSAQDGLSQPNLPFLVSSPSGALPELKLLLIGQLIDLSPQRDWLPTDFQRFSKWKVCQKKAGPNDGSQIIWINFQSRIELFILMMWVVYLWWCELFIFDDVKPWIFPLVLFQLAQS